MLKWLKHLLYKTLYLHNVRKYYLLDIKMRKAMYLSDKYFKLASK